MATSQAVQSFTVGQNQPSSSDECQADSQSPLTASEALVDLD